MSFIKDLLDQLRGGQSEARQSRHGFEIEGLKRVDIVGEASYQGSLQRLAGPKTEDGVSVWKVASLIPEPTNPHDPNAVVVKIEGLTVGYLSRTQARAFHVLMRNHATTGESLTNIKAEIRGGWKRKSGDEGSFGVGIYLDEVVAARLEEM